MDKVNFIFDKNEYSLFNMGLISVRLITCWITRILFHLKDVYLILDIYEQCLFNI